MTRTKIAVSALAAMTLLAGCSTGDSLETGSFPDRGKAVVSHIVRGDYAAVEARFTPLMKRSFTEAQLRDNWHRYETLFGSFESQGVPMVTNIGVYSVIRVPVTMSKQRGEVRVTFDANGLIAGLYFLRTGVPL